MSERPQTARIPIVVLISGSGTNLQAIIDAGLPVTVAAVISNRPGAGGLERARQAGIVTAVIDHTTHPDRVAFEQALAHEIDRHEPALVVLAGFMRILTPEFVGRYAGRMLNIHPSLLPALRGLDTHRRALAEGHTVHGCTVHFVTPELDSGPIVAQARVPVHPGDDEASLAARVRAAEHVIYPRAIGWFAEGRLALQDGRALLDGKPVDRADA